VEPAYIKIVVHQDGALVGRVVVEDAGDREPPRAVRGVQPDRVAGVDAEAVREALGHDGRAVRPRPQEDLAGGAVPEQEAAVPAQHLQVDGREPHLALPERDHDAMVGIGRGHARQGARCLNHRRGQHGRGARDLPARGLDVEVGLDGLIDPGVDGVAGNC